MDHLKSVHDKQPPQKESEEYLEEEIKSARNGFGGLLIAGFALARTLQVFSRTPGSCGVLLLAAWLAAVAVQAVYFQGHIEKHGVIDATPYHWMLVAQSLPWSVGCLMTVFRSRRRRPIPDRELGRGILSSHLPKLSITAAGVVSDIAIGCVLIVALHLLGSPVQAGWYQVITGWAVFCHSCVFLRGWSYRQRVRAAAKRSKSWRNDVRGRHHV